MRKKIAYLRISKEDIDKEELEEYGSTEEYLRVKWQQQEKALKNKFQIKEFDEVFRESGSAYDLDKIHKREMFTKVRKLLFNSSETTIEDLFMNNIYEREIDIYVWDYHRIMRNFKLSLLFGLLSDFFNIRIFSCKQENTEYKKNETPVQTFSRYVVYSANAFSSEEYSWNISTNVSKSVIKGNKKSTQSVNGKKWGRQFYDRKGKKVSLEKSNRIIKTIYNLIKYNEDNNFSFYYTEIQKKIRKNFDVMVSKAFLSKMRKEVIENAG